MSKGMAFECMQGEGAQQEDANCNKAVGVKT